MRRNLTETVAGALVLLAAAAFFFYAYGKIDPGAGDGYQINAIFDRADGIRPGTDVRLSGIKVGEVVSSSLDPETYLAVVRMNIRNDVKVPEDTSAKVASDGLLGDSFLALTPGGSEDMLPAGGEITVTQGAVDLITLIGKLFSQAGSDGANQ